MRTSTLFGTKTLGFFKIYSVFARGKVNFSRLCADNRMSFMDDPYEK